MREAIIEQALKEAGTRFVTVTFLTKAGVERKINGLLKPLSHIKGEPKATDAEYTPIWSPRIGWRSFKTSRVVCIKAEKLTIMKGA